MKQLRHSNLLHFLKNGVYTMGFTGLIPLFHWSMSLNPVVTEGLLKISGLFAVWDFMAK